MNKRIIYWAVDNSPSRREPGVLQVFLGWKAQHPQAASAEEMARRIFNSKYETPRLLLETVGSSSTRRSCLAGGKAPEFGEVVMACRKGEHMKTLGCRFVVIVVLTGLLFVSSVWARAGNAIEFKVTSSIVAGDAKFPAGTYTIRQDPDDQLEWKISNDFNGHNAFLPTDPSSPTTPNQKTEPRLSSDLPRGPHPAGGNRRGGHSTAIARSTWNCWLPCTC